jgi:hypothetical protein
MTGPLPSVPNAVKIRLVWTSESPKPANNVLYFTYTGGVPNSTDLQGFATDIMSGMGTHNGLWAADVSLSEVEVLDLSSPTSAVGIATGSHPGGLTPGGLDASTSMVCHYLINRRYRGGKPRSYFPFGDGPSLASRVSWDPAFVTLCNSSLASFFAGLAGKLHGATTFQNHANVSYYKGFHVVVDPETGYAKNVPDKRSSPLVDGIVGLACSSIPGSQRRRL